MMSSSTVVRLAWGTLVAITVVALVYLLLPTLIIVPLSFSGSTYLAFPPPSWSLKWYEAIADSQYPAAFANSVKVGVPAAALATVVGTLTALGVVRGRPRFARAMSSLAVAPFMLPQIVLAIGLYSIFAQLGLVGSYPAVILAHAVAASPLVFISVGSALRSYDATLETAAMTLGANWWWTFWLVSFPMIRLGVFAGAILAFSFSFDEIIMALFLTSSQTITLPKQLYSEMRFNLTPVVAAASTIVIAISCLFLVLVAVLQSKAARLRRAQQESRLS
jgi:ABC-type spermidine/putrescine transport system permease subunit II